MKDEYDVKRSDMRVEECMTRGLVFVPETMVSATALDYARQHGVHYLLVVDGDSDLSGVTCVCAITRAPVSSAVGSFAHSPVTYVVPGDDLEHAASIMRTCAIGCLPVLRAPGEVVGVITRHDLRIRGLLGGADGAVRCAACGATHDLVAGAPGVPFCRSCLESTPKPGTIGRRWYCTLGGGD